MKRTLVFSSLLFLLAGAAVATAADANEEIKAAAKKLGEASNYSWKQSSESANGGGNRGGGPTEGKTEKDGYTLLSISRQDNTTEVVVKGEKRAMKGEDGWKSASELADGNGGGQGRGRFAGAMLRNIRTPVAQAEALLEQTKDLKKSGDAYEGTLTEQGAKQYMTFGGGRRGGGGGNGPEISDAKGSVKFWVKDGVLSKYQYHVQGKVSFNGNDREIDRTTTIEIKDVGNTKVVVPEEAKKKVS